MSKCNIRNGTSNGRALPASVYFTQLNTDSDRVQRKSVRTE